VSTFNLKGCSRWARICNRKQDFERQGLTQYFGMVKDLEKIYCEIDKRQQQERSVLYSSQKKPDPRPDAVNQ